MRETTRRALLRQAGMGLLGRAALMSGFDRFGLVSALAAPIAPTDYKALVCIFMYGGNDANNTVIPLDATRFPLYTKGRPLLAFTSAQLAATTLTGGNFALHPSMTGLSGLYNRSGNAPVAILANVGTLTAVTTKASYQAGSSRPYQLFSHSDQQNQWQTSVSSNEH